MPSTSQSPIPISASTIYYNEILHTVTLYRIWGSHSNGYEEHYLLGYNTMQSVECQPMLQRNISPPSLGSKNKHLFSCQFLAWLIIRPRRWRRYVSPKRQLTFNALHNVISQKIVFFKLFYLLSGFVVNRLSVYFYSIQIWNLLQFWYA